MKKIMIDKYNPKFATYRWKKVVWEDRIDWVRTGNHLLYKNTNKEWRWLSFPVDIKREGKYLLSITFKTSISKQIIAIFLSDHKNTTQRIATFSTLENEKTTKEVEFLVTIENPAYLCFTATDFPISGEKLSIYELTLAEK